MNFLGSSLEDTFNYVFRLPFPYPLVGHSRIVIQYVTRPLVSLGPEALFVYILTTDITDSPDSVVVYSILQSCQEFFCSVLCDYVYSEPFLT